MEQDNRKTPIDRIYDSREKFTIIGLTGLAGSGCSRLASAIIDPEFFNKNNCVRKPCDIPFKCTTHATNTYPDEETLNIQATSQLIFKREYTICYDFISHHYSESGIYKLIKYTRTILLYTFLYAMEKKGASDSEKLHTVFSEMMQDKYRPSCTRDAEFKEEMQYGDDAPGFIEEVLQTVDWNTLFEELQPIAEKNIIEAIAQEHATSDIHKSLANLFFDNEKYNKIITDLCSDLSKKDYYSLCFMFHRLSCCIRNWGDPFTDSNYNFENVNTEYNHLYDVIILINFIIKGLKGEGARRVVIDSLRNSIEAQYLKERYTAFYLIAVHDDEHREDNFKQKVKYNVAPTLIEQEQNKKKIDLMHQALMHLMNIEVENDDFEKGKFHAPNVGQCIADAEIHISNVPAIDPNATTFYTMEEQWMKYAALILHPGLITPSSDERCMMVAYSAKFNSGCLSRQVGACITNQHHSIRTIGWNDPAYGQVPCYLRSLKDIKKTDAVSSAYYRFMYSEFEQGCTCIYDGGKYNFRDKVDSDYSNIEEAEAKLKGLPLSYCFKTLQNRYEGEKNQVYTRSLHAEENAMMQMVKYGGEGLMNGIIYVTASPCELCSKKLYQIGVRKIIYIDPYPGISRQHIIKIGFKRPALKQYAGAYGSTFYKLYQPFMSYKDEMEIRLGKGSHEYKTKSQLLDKILEKLEVESSATYTEDKFNEILKKIKKDE